MRDRKEIEIYRRDIIEILSRSYKRSEIEKCFPKKLAITCNLYQGICIVTAIDKDPGFDPLYTGWPVGIVIKGKAYPYPELLNMMYRCAGRIRSAVEARPQGVRAFLYGNDLLVASVNKIHRPFGRGDIVGVIDPEDGRVIGIGRASLDPEEIYRAISMGRDTEVVVENIFDLGWFLRTLKPVGEEY